MFRLTLTLTTGRPFLVHRKLFNYFTPETEIKRRKIKPATHSFHISLLGIISFFLISGWPFRSCTRGRRRTVPTARSLEWMSRESMRWFVLSLLASQSVLWAAKLVIMKCWPFVIRCTVLCCGWLSLCRWSECLFLRILLWNPLSNRNAGERRNLSYAINIHTHDDDDSCHCQLLHSLFLSAAAATLRIAFLLWDAVYLCTDPTNKTTQS